MVALVFTDDGSFEYTPNAAFHGEDSFTYYASDGSRDSVPVTVTLYVGDQVPTANPDEYTTDFLALYTVSARNGVLANDTDIENQQLTAVLEADASNGSLTFNSNGSFSYLPNPSFTV